MLTTRAHLVPYWYAAKGKWYPRGSWTEKDASGNLVRRRSTKGSGTDTRGACQVQCDALNVRLEAALNEGPHVPSFAEAAAVYIELGHEARFLHDRLLDVIGHVRCDEIDNATMVKAANTVYSGCAAVTINRQLYTPVVAVLSFAAQDQHWRPQKLKRPKGYAKLAPAKSPQTAWFERVLPECRLQLKALLLFITLTSRRVGEAIKLKPADFDPGEGTVLIQQDKAGNPVFIRLAPEVIEAISAYRWQDGPGLFGSYTPSNRRNVFRDLQSACKRAGVDYYTPHKAGRHAFAKRLLNAGKSLAHVKAAGGWASIRVVAELYGAFAENEIDDEARQVGSDWARQLQYGQDNPVGLQKKPEGR